MQDRPEAPELLDAVAAYLFAELRPLAPREERFRILVAANICAVVARELRAGPEPSAADLAAFSELLDSPPAGPVADPEAAAEAAAKELADRIRAGELDERLDETVALLSEHVRRKLEIARPDYPVGDPTTPQR